MISRLVDRACALWRGSVGAVLPKACRFTPSCSHYAAEAVQRRGLVLGLGLTVWRLLRCQPLCKGGYDPVVRSVPPCLPPGTERRAGGRPDSPK